MNTRLLAAFVIASVATIAVVASGCQKTLRSTDVVMADGDDATTVDTVADTPKNAGALLWSQNCARCHNLRNPRERSDRGWDIITHHMRVRGNLTAEEHRLILAFLQSAN